MTTRKTCQGLAYEVTGDATKAILFLHPAFTHGGAFATQVPAFADRYRVITLDLPGHGRTPAASKTAHPAPTMGDVARVLPAVLDAEDLDLVHVVGVSIGSLVAQDFVRRHPDRVRSLTVLDGYAVTDSIATKAQNREMLRWLPKVMFAMGSFRRYLAEVSVSTPQGKADFADLAEGFTRGSFLAMRGMEQILDVSRTDAVTCPLLITYGEYDMPAIREASLRWHRASAGSRIHRFDGAGHCANMDAPDAFNAALAEFLADLEGA